jgi:hypothetical protein
MNKIDPSLPIYPIHAPRSFTPQKTPSLPEAADLLYMTLQNRVAAVGDLQTLARLGPFFEKISTLRTMEEMHLLSSEETKEIASQLLSLEEDMRSFSQDLCDQLSQLEESLSAMLSKFQNGNTNEKIAYLLSQLPLIFCSKSNDEKALETRQALNEKVEPLQTLLQNMSPLEKRRWQKKLTLIEETFQKRSAHEDLSKKDLDEFFKNLE